MPILIESPYNIIDDRAHRETISCVASRTLVTKSYEVLYHTMYTVLDANDSVEEVACRRENGGFDDATGTLIV